jgi:hypothetical protein
MNLLILEVDGLLAAESSGPDQRSPDALRRNPQQRVRVAPDDLLKDLGRGRPLQQVQGLACHALSRQSCRRRVVALADAPAVAVAAAAVAAEEKLVLMALQEISGEPGSRDMALFPELADRSARRLG